MCDRIFMIFRGRKVLEGAAGKIFRTGLLMQGKSATISEMIRWVRAG
jgi:hypothetical protein